MDSNIKHLLAKLNNREKDFIDKEISNSVGEEVSISEENAQDRKAIQAIINALIKANIPLDEATKKEFEEYNSKVEQIKTDVKSKYK